MWLIMPFWMLILGLFLSLSLNLNKHWVARSSEQLRLDAVALSACHGRKDFIHKHIENYNRYISITQNVMRGIAPAGYFPPAYPATKQAIVGLANAAKLLTYAQKAMLLQFVKAEAEKHLELLIANELVPSNTDLLDQLKNSTLPFKRTEFLGVDDHLRFYNAWKEEILPADMQGHEKFYGAEWPKRLVPKDNFEELTEVNLRYWPDRYWMGKRNPMERDHLTLKKMSAGDSALKKAFSSQGFAPISSYSRCALNPNQNFKVYKKFHKSEKAALRFGGKNYAKKAIREKIKSGF